MAGDFVDRDHLVQRASDCVLGAGDGMIKCTGKEWRAFCADLPDCLYFDDCDFPDPCAVRDEDALRFECGVVAVQEGEEYAVPGVITLDEIGKIANGAAVKVETLFRRWKTARTSDTMLVQIPKADAKKFAETMKANKWRVVKS